MSGASFGRRLRYVGGVLGAVVLLLVLILVYAQFAPQRRYAVPAIALNVERSPERVARGEQIASMRCLDCHVDPTTGRATGRRVADVPPSFAISDSANITGDPKFGIGAWSDGELAYTLRTGVAKDGRLLPPWMPRMQRMSDEDLASLIAFLRSDRPVVQPAPVATPQTQWGPLGRVLQLFAFKPTEYPQGPLFAPAASDPVARGKYIVQGLADCWVCHSGSIPALDRNHPERNKGYLAGGTEFHDMAGALLVSSNLTPDEETGIGRWSERDFVRALREGLRPDNTPLRYPMRPYVELSEDDARAVFAYLRTVPPIRSRQVSSPVERSAASESEVLYQRYGCRSCHGDTGVGMGDLRKAAEDFPTDAELEAWIRRPSRIRPGTKMPDFDGIIAEEHFPLLIKHVRELGRRAR